jgi:hypothetical protein
MVYKDVAARAARAPTVCRFRDRLRRVAIGGLGILLVSMLLKLLS